MIPLGELRHAVFFDDSDVAKQLNRALAADVEDALGRVLARGVEGSADCTQGRQRQADHGFESRL